MEQKPQSAETYAQKLSQRRNTISQASSGTKSEKRLATQKLMESDLLMRAHNGSGIGSIETPRRITRGALSELFLYLALASTALGLGLLAYEGVI